MKKLLFVLNHFAGDTDRKQYNSARPELREERIKSLSACIESIWHTFGPASDTVYQNGAVSFSPVESRWEPQVVLATCNGQHVVDSLKLPTNLYQVIEVQWKIDPLYLGFCARQYISQNRGYDFYCHIEDDLILSDPLFFDKLSWFNKQAGDDCLLVPNRMELNGGNRCYIDGFYGLRKERKELSFDFLGDKVKFVTPDNVYAGSYFLNDKQLDKAIRDGGYTGYDSSWIGPLESCMSLPMQKAFEIYKPELRSGFLEIQHYGNRYVGV